MSFRRRVALTSGLAVAVAIVLASVIVYVVVRGQLRGQLDDSLQATANGAGLTSLPTVASASGSVSVARRAKTKGSATLEALPARATKLKAVPEASAKSDAATIKPTPTRPAIRTRAATPASSVALTLPPTSQGSTPGYTQIVTRRGKLFRAPGESGPALPTNGARQVADGQRDAFFNDVDVDGNRLRVLTSPAGPASAIQVARSLDEVDGSLQTLIWTLALVSLGGALLAAGLGYLIARNAVAPVAELTEAAEHVARTRDLGRRIGSPSRNDELARLALSFDSMLGELETSIGAQRRLVADASHELRTPLTSLRTNIEVLAQGGKLSESDRAQLLADVVSELEQLGVLVGDIVELARDEDLRPEEEGEVRLDQLVTEVVERARRRSPDVVIETYEEPCTVIAAPERLARAVANLLDNACKWSSAGGVVEVHVGDGGVTVRDHGPGIDADDLPHVFERFYRAAGARGTPGSGLGLAIVQQTAEAHGGTVGAERAAGGGTLMRLALPASRVCARALSPA